MIDVLVVDDSLYMQKRIAEMLAGHGDIRVVGKAKDGLQAIDMTRDLDPDVITMDLRMPRMGGLEAVEKIMASNPKPIVIFSSYSKRDGADSAVALELGVVDIVEKPSGSVSLELGDIGFDLVEKVRVASRVRVVRNAAAARALSGFDRRAGRELSMGGIAAGFVSGSVSRPFSGRLPAETRRATKTRTMTAR